MPLYKWEEIEDTLITPSKSQSRGKTIMGKHLLLQRVLHSEDRGDGTPGANTHSHPEEQIFIALKGKMRIRCVDEWFTMEEGDVFLMPANVEHEEICDGDFLWLNIKNRIPGHSWYDGSWVLGAQEKWEKIQVMFDEMDKKYKEKELFLRPKSCGLYNWDKLEETLITPSHTRSKGKTIMGKTMGIQQILHHEDRGDGYAGAKTHSHPKEQIFIALKGEMRIRAGNEWFTMEEGDIFVMPPYIEHDEICDNDFLWFNIKNRIPGYSWYDHSWVSEGEWKTVESMFDEMDKKYKEKTPWN